jgi:hypothetical protein
MVDSRQGNGMGMTWCMGECRGRVAGGERHGICELAFNAAGERHGICESAIRVTIPSFAWTDRQADKRIAGFRTGVWTRDVLNKMQGC